MPPRPPSPSPRRRLARAAAAALVLAGVAACSRGPSPADGIDLATARAEHEAGRAVLVDIREPAEHATGVAMGAKLLPMRQLRDRLAEIPADPARPVLLICNTQNRSKATLKALRDAGGHAHVRYVDGGMSEWARRGWPMVPPPR
jgi:rhodanese-related sulfurtransferase